MDDCNVDVSVVSGRSSHAVALDGGWTISLGYGTHGRAALHVFEHRRRVQCVEMPQGRPVAFVWDTQRREHVYIVVGEPLLVGASPPPLLNHGAWLSGVTAEPGGSGRSGDWLMMARVDIVTGIVSASTYLFATRTQDGTLAKTVIHSMNFAASSQGGPVVELTLDGFLYLPTPMRPIHQCIGPAPFFATLEFSPDLTRLESLCLDPTCFIEGHESSMCQSIPVRGLPPLRRGEPPSGIFVAFVAIVIFGVLIISCGILAS